MVNKTIRTVIRQGYSYLITLPVFWIQQSGLEEGGSIEISLGKDGVLVLTPYEDEEDEVEN